MDETIAPLPRTGRWQVTTETSLYLLDLDTKRVTRVPDAGAGSPPGLTAPAIASLRQDHKPVPLLQLIRCAVGEPMHMLIQLRSDGVGTLRITTVVRNLCKLAAERA